MDINSLLSPQETPRATPTPPSSKGPPKRSRRSAGAKAAGQPAKTPKIAPTSSYHANNHAQRPAPTPLPPPPSSTGRTSSNSTPSSFESNKPQQRTSSTAGMDTLADLASMQHHQQTARANAAGLRSAEIFDSPTSAATPLPNLQNMTRSEAASRLRAGSLDITMPEAQPPPRTYFSKALSEEELHSLTLAGNQIQQNPFAYNTFVELINLLHKGLLGHIRLQSGSGNLTSYELLVDLQSARENMKGRFALGEDLWADWIQDQILLATTFEDKIKIRELCERAVSEEPCSSKLWLVYAQWMLSEHHRLRAREDGASNGGSARHGSVTEEEVLLAKEIFDRQQVLSVWQRGAEETMWRINDSQQLWDPYTELLIQEIGTSPSADTISRTQHWFMNRLQTPHATWDQTSQSFSTFISNYDNSHWESTMVTANRLGSEAKQKYDMRDFKEINLLRASQKGDREGLLLAYNDYIDYELGLNRKKNAYSFELTNALFQRATLQFPANTDLWEAYVIFLNEEPAQHGKSDSPVMRVLDRATRHCPWSGTLWSQFILAAEIANVSFEGIEDIKHKATSTGILEQGDMNENLKIISAWCGYLRRRAFMPGSTDEEMDMAEVGIRSAIEDLETSGRRKYGKEYQGDPDFRLEKIYIKYLTQARDFSAARDTYRKLIPRKGHDHDFWLRFYIWEMFTWSKTSFDPKLSKDLLVKPTEATKVLQQAMRRTDLDWPERILQMYMLHCEDHEDAEQLQSATVETWRQTIALKKRREREAYEQYQYQQLQAQHSQTSDSAIPATNGEDGDHLGKRKRDEVDEIPSKKTRPEEIPTIEPQVQEQSPPSPSLLKRDRENATIIVRNLPATATELKVRQYFRDCGTINSLKLSKEEGAQSSVAIIEFELKEDVLTAQTKSGKLFDSNSIEVQIGAGSTIYVCNFPPAADDNWIREKFQQFGDIVDVRLPSLKYNTHRRFAYVQFQWPSQAHAATELDGSKVEGNLSLIAKISDPAQKKHREGAMYEGRELFVSNVAWSAERKELKTLFAQYGHVESVRIPKKVDGTSKGIGFVVFRNKEDAIRAMALNMTTWKGRQLLVAESTNDAEKRQVAIRTSRSQSAATSPGPSSYAERTQQRSASPGAQERKAEIQARTFALLNVPDTVNDARIRTIIEPHGEVVRIVLRPDHQGAIIEYENEASVGKAFLALDGYEITPGRQLGIGTVEDMKQLRAEKRSDKITTGQKKNATALAAPTQVRRPGIGANKKGGRGGLGAKHGGRGLGGERAKQSGGNDGHEGGVDGVEKEEPSSKPKSNADFKAMLLGS